MEESTQCNSPKIYEYRGNPIEVLPTFLYEVSLYKIFPNSASLLSSRYYTSNKLLKIEETKVVKRFKNFFIERFTTLLGTPISFIKDNNLSIYESKSIKKKKL